MRIVYARHTPRRRINTEKRGDGGRFAKIDREENVTEIWGMMDDDDDDDGLKRRTRIMRKK